MNTRNLINSSSRNNPFHYIQSEKDIFILVNTLIKNTTPPDSHAGDLNWENGEKLLLESLCLYLWHTAEEKNQSFENVLKLAEMYGDNAGEKSPLDLRFDDLENRDPDNLAVELYRTFQASAGLTAKIFVLSVSQRLEQITRPGKDEALDSLTEDLQRAL